MKTYLREQTHTIWTKYVHMQSTYREVMWPVYICVCVHGYMRACALAFAFVFVFVFVFAFAFAFALACAYACVWANVSSNNDRMYNTIFSMMTSVRLRRFDLVAMFRLIMYKINDKSIAC